MTNKHMTDEEMDQAGLTDEERAALESDDDVIQDDEGQDEPTAKADEPDTEDEPTRDEREDDASDTREEADDDAPGRDDGANADQPEEKVDGHEQATRQYTPSIRGDLPEDFDDRLGKINTDKAELRKKYNEGDIDFDEYEQQRDTLDEQRRQLEQKQFKSQIAQEMREDRWVNHDVAGFMAEHPEYKPGSALYTMLDAEVRLLQAKAADEGREQLDPSILRAAHQGIRERLAKDLGLEVGSKPAGKRTPPATRNAPPTLGALPAADIEDTDGGRWASLDRLADKDPVAFEERFESMSEAEQDAYLAAR